MKLPTNSINTNSIQIILLGIFNIFLVHSERIKHRSRAVFGYTFGTPQTHKVHTCRRLDATDASFVFLYVENEYVRNPENDS